MYDKHFASNMERFFLNNFFIRETHMREPIFCTRKNLSMDEVNSLFWDVKYATVY